MRIVYVGAVEFSRCCLEEIMRQGAEVVALFTLPRDRASFHSDYADLSEIALARRVPVHYVRNINDPSSAEQLRAAHPDIIFVFGWSQLISKSILQIPPMGCIGTHPALLPQHRGRHPIVWALVEGLAESGLTFFYLDESADSGDILWQRSFPISLEDDACTVYEKVNQLAKEGLREFIPQLTRGAAPRIPQDHSRATYWRKRGEKDGEIQWEAPTMRTYNLIRALTRPYAGAHTYREGKKIVVWRSRLPATSFAGAVSTLPPGTIIGRNEFELTVRTGDGVVALTEYECEDRLLNVGVQLGGRS